MNYACINIMLSKASFDAMSTASDIPLTLGYNIDTRRIEIVLFNPARDNARSLINSKGEWDIVYTRPGSKPRTYPGYCILKAILGIPRSDLGTGPHPICPMLPQWIPLQSTHRSMSIGAPERIYGIRHGELVEILIGGRANLTTIKRCIRSHILRASWAVCTWLPAGTKISTSIATYCEHTLHTRESLQLYANEYMDKIENCPIVILNSTTSWEDLSDSPKKRKSQLQMLHPYRESPDGTLSQIPTRRTRLSSKHPTFQLKTSTKRRLKSNGARELEIVKKPTLYHIKADSPPPKTLFYPSSASKHRVTFNELELLHREPELY